MHGGRIGGERELPSSDVLIDRAIAKLREVRTMCLNTSPEKAKFKNHDEYRKDLLRREGFGGDLEDTDDDADNAENDHQNSHPDGQQNRQQSPSQGNQRTQPSDEQSRSAKKARVEGVQEARQQGTCSSAGEEA